MTSRSAKLPTWYRVVAIIVGVLSIVLSLIVLIEPGLAVWLLIFLLALAMMFIGMDRLVVGISGHPFWWADTTPPTAPSQPSGTSPGSTPPSKP